MCIIILNKQHSTLPETTLKNCFKNNPDGSGFAYSKGGKLIIIKGIFDIKEFLSEYKRIKKTAESDVLIHCRISTGGKIDTANTHPHIVNDNLCLAHNGILSNITPTKTKSDTKLFIEQYLKGFTAYDLIHNDGLKKLLSYAIGNFNKFVFMDSNGQTSIINEDMGETDAHGNWFSNSTYKKSTMSLIDEEIYFLINDLSELDFYELGINPYIDLQTISLHKQKLFNDRDFLKLSKYSPELYSEYLELYNKSMYNLCPIYSA